MLSHLILQNSFYRMVFIYLSTSYRQWPLVFSLEMFKLI